MKSFCAGIFDIIQRSEKVVAVAMFVVMSAALTADVIGRELVGQGIFGAAKFAVLAMIFCAMACFGICTATGAHLRPRIADQWIPKLIEPAVVRLGYFFSATILFGITVSACQAVAFSYVIEERDLALEWVIWPFQSILPIAFFLSGLRFLGYAVWPDLAPAEKRPVE